MSQQGHALSPGRDPGHLSSDRRRPIRAQPEGVLPRGFLRELLQRTPRRGEQRLALAILEDAALRVRRTRRWARLWRFPIASEAERWVASRDRARLFSFENVCLILSVDPGEVREWILRRRSRRPSPAVERSAFVAR
jgi:hypothetical protein